MKVSYYLTTGKHKNLACRITANEVKITISLNHFVEKKKWNHDTKLLTDGSEYAKLLRKFKLYLEDEKIDVLNTPIKTQLDELKAEIMEYVKEDGLEGLQRALFNKFSEYGDDYDTCIKAIEKFTGFSRKNIKVDACRIGISMITIELPNGICYIVDTEYWHYATIESAIKEKNIDYLYSRSDPSCWLWVYYDGGFGGGIDKLSFISEFINKWEQHWDWENNVYHHLREEYFNEAKAKSREHLTEFIKAYALKDAEALDWDGDDIDFGPLFVLTMLEFYDLFCCLDEYTEFYFDNNYTETESIDLNDYQEIDEEDDSTRLIPTFYFARW